MTTTEFLTIAEVKGLVGYFRAWFYYMMNHSCFPRLEQAR